MDRSSDSASILEPSGLDSELTELPAPPSDLPKPWDWSVWQRWLAFGFPATALGLWLLAKVLNVELLQIFGLTLAATGVLYLWIGLYLMNRFGMRGFYENYAARANRRLNDALRRYRRSKPREAWLSLFPRYEVDGQPYYLVWYVPGANSALVANLSGGAEPLLFDHSGRWLDDEALFGKVILMWSLALEISPRGFPFDKSLVRDIRRFRKIMVRRVSKLPELLDANESKLRERGFGTEVERVRAAFDARCALLRSGLHILERKLEWRDAYGWDSLTVLRYEDAVAYHEAYTELVRAWKRFAQMHGIREAEAAAVTIGTTVKRFRGRFAGWKKRKDLYTALAEFSTQIPIEEHDLIRDDTEWKAPPRFVRAYRSRLDYAREVDARMDSHKDQAEVARQ